ncbi:hypothetical protein GGH92_010633 [Coemansia sp. RSA 2673]|nr:hypothetical protein GGH92_010633 [Coemansia sp. RSA 2673]
MTPLVLYFQNAGLGACLDPGSPTATTKYAWRRCDLWRPARPGRERPLCNTYPAWACWTAPGAPHNHPELALVGTKPSDPQLITAA